MNAFLQQVRTLWGQLGLNQKVTLILATVGLMVAFSALLMWSSRPQRELLYSGLDPRDTSEVVAALEEMGVSYEMGAGGTSVFVEGGDASGVRAKLMAQGVTPNGGVVGWDIFDKGNFGISDRVQQINYMRAVQGELARTIGQINGVRSARVAVVMPENRLLLADRNDRPTASVFVDTGAITLEPNTVQSIRYLVANSVEGLQASDVAVVDANGTLVSPDPAQEGGLVSGQFKIRKQWEDYFSSRIETMLTPVVGAGGVVARVSVDIETDASTTVQETFDPDGQVVRSQSVSEDKSTSLEGGGAGGIAGVTPNVPGGAQEGGVAGSTKSEQNRSNKTTEFEINKSTTEVVRSPGTIREVTAAVLLNQRMVENQQGEMVSEPRSTEELERIRKMVVSALGLSGMQGQRIQQMVSVEEVPFSESTLPAAPPGGLQGQLMPLIDSVRRFASVVIAIAMFIIFLRLLKGGPRKSSSAQIEVVDEGGSKEPAYKPFQESAPSLTPELLNDLIAQKPDNVGTALKTWVRAAEK